MEDIAAERDPLSDLHQRYVLLSGRFKAYWTFHQFLKGVAKVFAEEHPFELDGVPFQSILSELKTASKNLSVATAEVADGHLDNAARELENVLGELMVADEGLTPSLLRRFLSRVRNYDARILGQLLKFFLYTRVVRWDDDRIDKTDFLLTRVGELLLEVDVSPLERRPTALRDTLRSLWSVLDQEEPTDEWVSDVLLELDRHRSRLQRARTLEDLHDNELISAYRAMKRRLGFSLFQPDVSERIIEVNLFLRKKIDSFYQLEEARVAEEYSKVLELGQESGEHELGGELRSFRSQLEELERSVQGQNVKITQIVSVRERARDLLPRLSPETEEETEAAAEEAAVAAAEPDPGPVPAATEAAAAVVAPLPEPAPDESTATAAPEPAPAGPSRVRAPSAPVDWRAGLSERRPTETLRVRTGHADLLGEALRRVLQILENTDWEMAPSLVVQIPEARDLRMEPREVLAYRRLFFPERFERRLEQFLVESSALRLLIAHQAEELADFLDVSGAQARTSLRESARATVALASEFEKRFQHFIQRAVFERDASDAAELQFLWMRLVREYSGLWLLLNR